MENLAAPPLSHQHENHSHPSNSGLITPDDWAQLKQSDRVSIQLENGSLTAGTVDMVTPDGSVFWVWLNNGLGRIALHHGDNIQVRLQAIRS
jgi:hypothetical protein